MPPHRLQMGHRRYGLHRLAQPHLVAEHHPPLRERETRAERLVAAQRHPRWRVVQRLGAHPFDDLARQKAPRRRGIRRGTAELAEQTVEFGRPQFEVDPRLVAARRRPQQIHRRLAEEQPGAPPAPPRPAPCRAGPPLTVRPRGGGVRTAWHPPPAAGRAAASSPASSCPVHLRRDLARGACGPAATSRCSATTSPRPAGRPAARRSAGPSPPPRPPTRAARPPPAPARPWSGRRPAPAPAGTRTPPVPARRWRRGPLQRGHRPQPPAGRLRQPGDRHRVQLPPHQPVPERPERRGDRRTRRVVVRDHPGRGAVQRPGPRSTDLVRSRFRSMPAPAAMSRRLPARSPPCSGTSPAPPAGPQRTARPRHRRRAGRDQAGRASDGPGVRQAGPGSGRPGLDRGRDRVPGARGLLDGQRDQVVLAAVGQRVRLGPGAADPRAGAAQQVRRRRCRPRTARAEYGRCGRPPGRRR